MELNTVSNELPRMIFVAFGSQPASWLTFASIAFDFYNISLYHLPEKVKPIYTNTCDVAIKNGEAVPVKWRFQETGRSFFQHWRYAHPGWYCVTASAYHCTNCTKHVSQPVLVREDTSENEKCCLYNATDIKLLAAQNHRHDESLKSALIILDLRKWNPCSTRFHIQVSTDTANGTLTTAKPILVDDEIIPNAGYAIHNVPKNASLLRIRITPRCDPCAFRCSSSEYLLPLHKETLLEKHCYPLKCYVIIISIFIIVSIWMKCILCLKVFNCSQHLCSKNHQMAIPYSLAIDIEGVHND